MKILKFIASLLKYFFVIKEIAKTEAMKYLARVTKKEAENRRLSNS